MRLLALLIIVMIGGCRTQLINPVTSTPPTSDELWQSVAPGLQHDLIRADAVLFQAARIDPAYYEFRAHYSPGNPLTIEQWREQLPDADVIVNANFFDPANTVLGLLISDGIRYGTPYRDRGGTFYVDNTGVSLKRNASINGSPDTAIQAVQAFPMLVDNRQPLYDTVDDVAISRRTVIALDSEGQVIIMVTAGFGLTLPDLSAYLAQSDLNMVTALNLDGGGSTMLHIAPNESTVTSLDPVPVVLAAYPIE